MYPVLFLGVEPFRFIRAVVYYLINMAKQYYKKRGSVQNKTQDIHLSDVVFAVCFVVAIFTCLHYCGARSEDRGEGAIMFGFLVE